MEPSFVIVCYTLEFSIHSSAFIERVNIAIMTDNNAFTSLSLGHTEFYFWVPRLKKV